MCPSGYAAGPLWSVRLEFRYKGWIFTQCGAYQVLEGRGAHPDFLRGRRLVGGYIIIYHTCIVARLTSAPCCNKTSTKSARAILIANSRGDLPVSVSSTFIVTPVIYTLCEYTYTRRSSNISRSNQIGSVLPD